MPPRTQSDARRCLPALEVHQWLEDWDDVKFDPQQFRTKPPEAFYLFTLGASELRALAGIFRRSTEGGTARSLDLGIQRRHEAERSQEIGEFVKHGFPWSSLSKQRRQSGEFEDLKKPGWLPTAIVVNILTNRDTRDGKSVHAQDQIEVRAEKGACEVLLPQSFKEATWHPQNLPPIEVIDGQHRLWAFSERDTAAGYSLPVVAFVGLDISWQAYLFYTINIKPKKINTSLAYDLYPLLRTEDWLEKFEGHSIYRETRAQELTEAQWSHPASAWHQRIDMLGGRGARFVTQAAWIRSLLNTLVKSFDPTNANIGGLFGASRGEHKPVLGWSRAEQSAFVLLLWQELEKAVTASKDPWAQQLRDIEQANDEGDPAFSGKYTLLNNDQGVRGVLAVANDLCWMRYDELKLGNLDPGEKTTGTAEAAISKSLATLRKEPVGKFIQSMAKRLASYDWRSSGTPGLPEEQRADKARFRGGTGYREIRMDLIRHLTGAQGDVASAARDVQEALQ
jgi:DGQHR domain-containing protein